jgi:hypothetical protein
MNIAYDCKFCHQPGVVILEDGAPMFQVESWKPLLCCNRCGDYQEQKRETGRRILRGAVLLLQVRVTLSGQKLKDEEQKIQERLTALTKRYAAVVCDHFRVTNIWQEEFVLMLMEQPRQVYDILRRYIKGVAEAAQQPQPHPEPEPDLNH